LRIERMNKRKMQKNVAKTHTISDDVEEWQKKTALNHISFIREQKKEELVENLIKSHKTMEKDLAVTPGEPSFLSILVNNPSKRADVYSVKFEDPDKDVTPRPEMSLIHNYDNGEWKYWNQNGKCVEPPAWDMVDDGGNIYLDPNQE